MVSLRKHLQKAGKARWAKKTEAERKAHAAMMSEKRWPKRTLENDIEKREAE